MNIILSRNLSIVQRTVLAVGCGAQAIIDPYRYDCVAYAAEATTPPCVLSKLADKMKNTEEGRLILKDKPNIHSSEIDLEYLANLEDNLFGKEYFKMLEQYSISPDTRVPVKFIDGETNEFIMRRFRQCHDLLHLLLQAPTTFEGEAYVKAYEFHQTGLLVPLIGFSGAPLYRLNRKRFSRHLHRTTKLRNLPTHPFYLSFYFEKRWDQPISDIRHELGIENYLY